MYDILCICPEFPGKPSLGFAIKHGVIPYFEPRDFTTYLLRSREVRTGQHAVGGSEHT